MRHLKTIITRSGPEPKFDEWKTREVEIYQLTSLSNKVFTALVCFVTFIKKKSGLRISF